MIFDESFFLDGISRIEFFQNYWHKRPLFLSGGGNYLFEKLILQNQVSSIIKRRTDIKQDIKRYKDGTLFIDRIDRYIPALRQKMHYIARSENWSPVWFDSTLAHDGGGLGRHFDESDNFVFQQEGVKQWDVEFADCIPDDYKRARLLSELRTGMLQNQRYEGSQKFSYTLLPGDVLYIPLFFPHRGISMGDTFSISFACGAKSLLDYLDENNIKLLKHQPEVWQPIPNNNSYSDQKLRQIIKQRICFILQEQADEKQLNHLVNHVMDKLSHERLLMRGGI